MEKEEGLKAKKKDDPNELKVYSNGVGKFLNPTLKKEARYAEKYFFLIKARGGVLSCLP